MHADPVEVRKSIRTYMMVFGSLLVLTVITVAVAELQLTVGLAIALALVIATAKASLVAAYFMHLNHEKMWIYGSLLLTAVFFLVLMLVPAFTNIDSFGTEVTVPAAAAESHDAGH
jgi:cytochrome c oxidase subunit 4